VVVVYDIEGSSATPIYDSILGTCTKKKRRKRKENDSPFLKFGPENSFRGDWSEGGSKSSSGHTQYIQSVYLSSLFLRHFHPHFV
jgi:hypothetical protein